MDSIRIWRDEVRRNLSALYKNLTFCNRSGEISGEKARIERFLLIISVEYGALERDRERHCGIEQVAERVRAFDAVRQPGAVLLVGAVRRKRLGRADERGSLTGFAEQPLDPLQAAAGKAAAVRQMEYAAHVVQRVINRSGRDAHPVD